MKIALSFEGDYLVIPADKAQPLIEALAHGQLYERLGVYDESAEFTPVNKKPKVLFVSDIQINDPNGEAMPQANRQIAPETQSAEQSLSSLQSWRDFHATEDGKRLFPGLESLRWFLRENRDELIAKGVMLKIRGQWHLVRPSFDKEVISCLQRRAVANSPSRMDGSFANESLEAA